MTVYEKTTQVIQMYYYLVDSSFTIIKTIKNNDEIKTLYVNEFINVEKWNISKYLKEIEELNKQLKKLIHE